MITHRLAPRYAVATMLAAVACSRSPVPGVRPAGAPAPTFAAGDSVTIDTVAPEVVHYRLRRPTGPFNVQIVTVPVRSARYEITTARALDSLRGRERVTDMVRRRAERGERIIAALNADFFDLGTGANENNQVIDGEIWKAVRVTDSPYDTFRNAHSQFALGADGRAYLDRFVYDGVLSGTCGRFVLDGVNGVPRVADALVLFTSAFGAGPRGDSVHVPAELMMGVSPPARAKIGALELSLSAAPALAGMPIPPERAVLASYGTTRARLDSIARCPDALRLTHAFRPDRGHLTMIVGGWPRVVRDGRSVAGAADSVEGTFPRFSAQRHPRSAIGVSRDSTHVYLVAVDGRQETSDGMTLAELADFLVSIGVYQGLNLDGGGSTALVIDGRLANRPSDAAGERAVGNALLVRQR